VILTGRLLKTTKSKIRVTGRAGDHTHEIRLPVDPGEESASHQGISSVWARMKIAELYDRSVWDPDGGLPEQIKTIALQHSLISAYTAFVSVDSLTRTAGDHGTTVQVAVPVPEGVRYETTVQE
jgi:Ca-activated chloride channel family protein